MNTLYIRTFKDPQLLEEMLMLRKEGWSITALAEKYDCNFTSIWHQCRKYHIAPVKVTIRLTRIQASPTYVDFDGTPVNRGKTYKEYLREQEDRKRARFNLLLQERMQNHVPI